MDDLPALYWVTLCCVCLRHFLPLQNVRRSLGKLTLGACVWACEGGERRGGAEARVGESADGEALRGLGGELRGLALFSVK